jgi:hypothetical protein
MNAWKLDRVGRKDARFKAFAQQFDVDAAAAAL